MKTAAEPAPAPQAGQPSGGRVVKGKEHTVSTEGDVKNEVLSTEELIDAAARVAVEGGRSSPGAGVGDRGARGEVGGDVGALVGRKDGQQVSLPS